EFRRVLFRSGLGERERRRVEHAVDPGARLDLEVGLLELSDAGHQKPPRCRPPRRSSSVRIRSSTSRTIRSMLRSIWPRNHLRSASGSPAGSAGAPVAGVFPLGAVMGGFMVLASSVRRTWTASVGRDAVGVGLGGSALPVSWAASALALTVPPDAGARRIVSAGAG